MGGRKKYLGLGQRSSSLVKVLLEGENFTRIFSRPGDGLLKQASFLTNHKQWWFRSQVYYWSLCKWAPWNIQWRQRFDELFRETNGRRSPFSAGLIESGLDIMTRLISASLFSAQAAGVRTDEHYSPT